jgi:hypothetical protein
LSALKADASGADTPGIAKQEDPAMRRLIVPLALSALAPACKKFHDRDAESAVKDYEVDYTNQELGNGYLSLEGKAAERCIEYSDVRPTGVEIPGQPGPVDPSKVVDALINPANGNFFIDRVPGRQITFEVATVSSKEEMLGHLGIGSSASIEGSFNPVVRSVNGKVNLAASFNSSNDSVYILIKVKVHYNKSSIKDPRLTARAVEMLKQVKADGVTKYPGAVEFFDACGDHFTDGFVTGGEYFGLIEIKNSLKSRGAEIKSSLDVVAGKIVDAKLSVEQEAAIKSATGMSNLTVRFLRLDGNVASTAGTTRGAMTGAAVEPSAAGAGNGQTPSADPMAAGAESPAARKFKSMSDKCKALDVRDYLLPTVADAKGVVAESAVACLLLDALSFAGDLATTEDPSDPKKERAAVLYASMKDYTSLIALLPQSAGLSFQERQTLKRAFRNITMLWKVRSALIAQEAAWVAALKQPLEFGCDKNDICQKTLENVRGRLKRIDEFKAKCYDNGDCDSVAPEDIETASLIQPELAPSPLSIQKKETGFDKGAGGVSPVLGAPNGPRLWTFVTTSAKGFEARAVYTLAGAKKKCMDEHAMAFVDQKMLMQRIDEVRSLVKSRGGCVWSKWITEESTTPGGAPKQAWKWAMFKLHANDYKGGFKDVDYDSSEASETCFAVCRDQ